MQDTYALLDQDANDRGEEVASKQSGNHRFHSEPGGIVPTVWRECPDAADLNRDAGKICEAAKHVAR